MRVYIVPVEQYIPNESEVLKYLRYMNMVEIENILYKLIYLDDISVIKISFYYLDLID